MCASKHMPIKSMQLACLVEDAGPSVLPSGCDYDALWSSSCIRVCLDHAVDDGE